MLKRNIHQAQGFVESQTQGFFMVSKKASETAIINRLTGSQYRLWHYLMMIQPFADQTVDGERIYRDIPSPADIGIAIGANHKTVEKDMRRLEQLGLYTKRVTGWQGYNLTAEDARNVSDAMKQANAERATDPSAKQRPKTERIYKNNSKALQNNGCYLAPDDRYLAPDGSYLAPDGSYLAPSQILATQSEEAFPAPAILPQTIQNFRSSSDLREEDLKFKEKDKVEVDQGNGDEQIVPGSDRFEAPLSKNLEPCDQTTILVDDCPPQPNLNEKIDKNFLLWVMEVKIPSLNLDKPIRNLDFYARAMIKRDGQSLRQEFAEIQAEAQFHKQAADLAELVNDKVALWRTSGSTCQMMVYQDLGGMPMVLMDGSSMAAVDFLNKPIEATTPTVATAPVSPEDREKRPARLSRLKMAAKINEFPGFEFLQECWGDIVLRSQVAITLKKHPTWASIKDEQLMPGSS